MKKEGDKVSGSRRRDDNGDEDEDEGKKNRKKNVDTTVVVVVMGGMGGEQVHVPKWTDGLSRLGHGPAGWDGVSVERPKGRPVLLRSSQSTRQLQMKQQQAVISSRQQEAGSGSAQEPSQCSVTATPEHLST